MDAELYNTGNVTPLEPVVAPDTDTEATDDDEQAAPAPAEDEPQVA